MSSFIQISPMSLQIPQLLARLCAGILLIGLAHTPAAAQAPELPMPMGWTVSASDILVVQSPIDEKGVVSLVAPLVLPPTRDLKAAFAEDVRTLIEDLIGKLETTAPPLALPPSDFVAPGLRLPSRAQAEDGTIAEIETTGYVTRAGLQIVLVVWPADLDPADPRLLAARDTIETWRERAYVLKPDDLAALAATAEEGQAGVSPPSQDPDDRVQDVIHYLRLTLDAAPASRTTEPVGVTVLLLSDGRAFENEARAPADFDPATRPLGSPGAGRWRRDGEAYAVDFADGSQGIAVAKAAMTRPGEPGMTLKGAFRTALQTSSSGERQSAPLPETIEFFTDGSAKFAAASGAPADSVRYRIIKRTISFNIAGEQHAYVFGFSGEADNPSVLVIGNRVYERIDTAEN